MEFQEVIKQMKLMCAFFSPMCNGCKLCMEMGTNNFCGEEPKEIRSDPALVEAVFMEWAAEHPEPVYETWGQYFRRYYGLEYCKGHEMLLENIPADIAKKLGIKTKEV